MKKLSSIFGFIIYLIICFSLPVTASAADVSGIITADTTWTLSNSPYIVTGSVIVDSGAALTIEPGVIVKFDGNMDLQIEGTLIAIGTETDNITFTSNQAAPAAGDWAYIFFADSSADAAYDPSGNYTGGSILEYCVIEYGGSTGTAYNAGALQMDNSHPFINYCTITNSSSSGIHADNLTGTLKITNGSISNNSGGAMVSDGTAIISNNTISDNIKFGITTYYSADTISDNVISNNDGDGIYVRYGTSTIISGNTVSDNTSDGINIDSSAATISDNIVSSNIENGIYVRNGSAAAISYNTIDYNGTGISAGAATISNNTISNSNHRGIYISDISTISNNTISSNTTTGDGAGIFVGYYGNAAISYNTIADNIAAGSGGGIYIAAGGSDASGTAAVTNNSITGNSAENASALFYRSEIPNMDFGNNIITDNTATGASSTCTVLISGNPLFNFNEVFNNTATYKLCNDNAEGTPNVDATNNWWGTSIDSEIQASIYDWFDNASIGVVDYEPYLNSPDGEPEPDISADIQSKDFGNVDAGDSLNQIITISNIGAADLDIGNLYLAGSNPDQFSIQNDNCSGAAIAPLGSCTFDAVFSPTEAGALNAIIGVNSNDPDTPTIYIDLSGTGIVQAFTIEAAAGANGSISPSGEISVDYGEDVTFEITPDAGYRVADVLVDSVSVGPAASYTFSSITSSHTIIATFAEKKCNKQRYKQCDSKHNEKLYEK